MGSKIQKLGDTRVVALPPDLVVRLGWNVGDVLTAEILKDGIKFTRTSTKHDRAMQIAREVMDEYRMTFEALAKS